MNIEHEVIIIKDEDSADKLKKLLDSGYVLMSVNSIGSAAVAIIGRTMAPKGSVLSPLRP